jgi:hypothetical protein
MLKVVAKAEVEVRRAMKQTMASRTSRDIFDRLRPSHKERVSSVPSAGLAGCFLLMAKILPLAVVGAGALTPHVAAVPARRAQILRGVLIL